jgi:small subunit ribosomal protein S18
MQQRITRAKPRVCQFCQEKTVPSYKEIEVLGRFLTERGRIVPRSRTFVCPKHQRRLTAEIKRARYLAFLPFVVTRI